MAYDKVVDSAQLDSIFTDIADAVRSRSGTSEEIAHTDIADAVLTMPSNFSHAWEKCMDTFTIGEDGLVSADVSNASSSYLPYTYVSLNFYKDVYMSTGDALKIATLLCSLRPDGTIANYYEGETIFTAEEIPDEAYFTYSSKIYRTTANTDCKVVYSNGRYRAQLSNVELVEGQRDVLCNIGSDDADAYPENGTIDGFYYRKLVPIPPMDNVWERRPYGIVNNGGEGTSLYSKITVPDDSGIFPVGTIPVLTFYKNVVYDESSGTFTGKDILYTFVQESDITKNENVLISSDIVPDDAYIFCNGSPYKTTSNTRFSVSTSFTTDSDGNCVYSLYLASAYQQKFGKGSVEGYICSDNSTAYTSDGVDGNYYYKKMLPDSYLTAGNIRKGVTICGVTGTFEHVYDSDLVPANIREGVNILGVTGTYLRDTDSDLIASNIKKGVNIYGVTGTYEGEASSNNGTVNITIDEYNMLSFMYQYNGVVYKGTYSDTYTVDKGSMFVMFLRGTGSTPTVSGASYKQYTASTAYSKASTSASTYYYRVYAFIADSDMTITC